MWPCSRSSVLLPERRSTLEVEEPRCRWHVWPFLWGQVGSTGHLMLQKQENNLWVHQESSAMMGKPVLLRPLSTPPTA